MKISKVEISNWRSIRSMELDAQDLMVIIGQNNHGKSNLISALLFFFGEVKLQDLDFCHGTIDLFVEVVFTGLDDEDKVKFKKYLTHDGTIVVRKSGFLDGNFEYRGYIENPEEEWLKEANAAAYSKRETAQTLPLYSLLPATGRISKQHFVDAQTAYIEKNRDSLSFRFELEETQFMGLKSVAKGIFGEVYFIPAIKEASDDFSAKESSVFGKLYSDVISAMSEEDQDWKDTRERLTSLFATLNKVDGEGNTNENRPEQLTDFEQELTAELSGWGAEIEIQVSPPDIDAVFRANTQVWVDDGVRTDIRRKGHGLQRALIVALIQVVSKRVGQGAGGAGPRTASKSRYFFFEEPELYLHPQAQRLLFHYLSDLSRSGSQVILCTHSSGLINLKEYKSIYIVSKENEQEGSTVRQCTEELFAGDPKKDFNLSYWVNPDRGELFFAKKVILVEGPTEKTVLPILAKSIDKFRYDYSVIDCGSKTTIPLYIKLLNKFSIPYVAVYDLDHQSVKGTSAITSADLASRKIEDELDSSIGSSVIFENDIEEELGLVEGSSGKPFAALTHVSDEGFSLSDAMKEKVRLIYR